MSLVITNLYTNIPLQETVEFIKKKQENSGENNKDMDGQIIGLINITLKQIYF
jgi:hypothetical protein